MPETTSASISANDDDDANNWDSICVHPHADYLEEGRRQGRQAGLEAGWDEGYALGRTTAMDYGMELGFMRGVVVAAAKTTLTTSSSSSSSSSERVQKSLQELRSALDDFPGAEESLRFNHQESANNLLSVKTSLLLSHDGGSKTSNDDSEPLVDIRGQLQRIRARFKLFMVQLGMPHFSLKQLMDDAAAAATTTTTTTRPAELSLAYQKGEKSKAHHNEITTEW